MLRLIELPNETEDYRYTCDYTRNDRMSDRFIENCRLFDFQIEQIKGEDLFSGILGKTEFDFSELTLIQIQTQTDSKGHTTQSNVTMFDGILFTADFHKDFDGVTILRSANMFNTGAVGSFFQS